MLWNEEDAMKKTRNLYFF